MTFREFVAMQEGLLAPDRPPANGLSRINPFPHRRRIKLNSFPPTVRRVAEAVQLVRAAHNERSMPSGQLEPARLAVLADPLEEAGAPEEVLSHRRRSGPHVRGRVAVD